MTTRSVGGSNEKPDNPRKRLLNNNKILTGESILHDVVVMLLRRVV
jgi:hypothetical protein